MLGQCAELTTRPVRPEHGKQAALTLACKGTRPRLAIDTPAEPEPDEGIRHSPIDISFSCLTSTSHGASSERASRTRQLLSEEVRQQLAEDCPRHYAPNEASVRAGFRKRTASQTTLREIQRPRRDGLIRRVHGRGTFYPNEPAFAPASSTSTSASRSGHPARPNLTSNVKTKRARFANWIRGPRLPRTPPFSVERIIGYACR